MRAFFSRITAFIAGGLPDLTRVPPRRQIAGALILSALLHLIGFPVLVVHTRLFPMNRTGLVLVAPKM